jgi:tRNA threonylcarbamoyladenosine biosynthesis protein TsaE
MIIATAEHMFDRGREVAQHHPFLLVQGDLGAGKTTFTKGYAAGLGIDPDLVHSPTFTYMNVYNEKLLHIDMYRLEHSTDLLHK